MVDTKEIIDHFINGFELFFNPSEAKKIFFNPSDKTDFTHHFQAPADHLNKIIK